MSKVLTPKVTFQNIVVKGDIINMYSEKSSGFLMAVFGQNRKILSTPEAAI
jgi:hypothetical protein